MFIFYCILLGTVQGLTEFLPVSSSGHLVLLERLLGVSFAGGSMTFLNLMLHLGTLFAVVFAYRKELLALTKQPRRILQLAAATVPAGAAGLLLGERADAVFTGERGIFWLALCFGFTACLLLLAEVMAKKTKKPFGWRQTAAMGLMQAVAILPGVSRSGSTIAAGMLAGGDAKEATSFSFLMSIPVILGGILVSAVGAAKSGAIADMGVSDYVGTALGVVISAVVGLGALHLMKRAAERAGYLPFALYLLLLAIAVLLLDLFGCV